jgi:signal transduction histidine kinase
MVDSANQASSLNELSAVWLQLTITAGLAVLSLALHRWFRKPYFQWWTIGWGLYSLRITAILLFLSTADRQWLYWHQVTTGWTALAILWAAVSFSSNRSPRLGDLLLALFPPLWSYVAIYQLDNFLLAAGPAVLFLSFATLWTGKVFVSHFRATGSKGGLALAVTFLLWGLHHLDYPLLRARGTWNPWGYYLDILFVLATATGMLLLASSLENADLYRRLEERALELERLSARMVRQNEEQRRRLSLELHDETAQVLAAVKLQLGLLREGADLDATTHLDRLLRLIDTGIQSIRSVTSELRPPLLDDLGWLPAVRGLVQEFTERTGVAVHLDATGEFPAISREAELALFRSVQEALANVARHANAQSVAIGIVAAKPGIRVRITDDGQGFGEATNLLDLEQRGHLGLAGMRERILAIGGKLQITGAPRAGVRIEIVLPQVAAG